MINTILLATNFSQNANHAGFYAIELAKQIGATKIVVYHTYNVASISEPMLDYSQQLATEPFRQESISNLEQLVALLRTKTDHKIIIEAHQSYATLTDAVNEIANITEANLIVMGISGGSKLKEVVVGSHSLAVAKHTNIPVLIVPTDAAYKNIQKVLLVSDLKDVETTIPSNAINILLSASKAQLSVLHITENTNDQHTIEKEQLNHIFANHLPEYHFVQNNDFTAAVDEFVAANQIDLVIVVPKKHGIFKSIFNVNHTKTLAFHSKVPLVVAHN